ncbi:MAG TPA: ribosome recycling factor [Patescibacteria group bacterium]
MSYNFSDFEVKMDKALQHVRQDIGSLRTGKASPQLLDPVMVEVYGTRMKISEVANISATDPTLLVVSPWDKSILSAIEKSINIAGLNLNPVVDGEIIRIAIPPLTEERRKEMVKILHQKIENGRVMMRTVRADAKKEIEAMKGEAGVSEDDIAADVVTLDKKFQEKMDELDSLSQHKEVDLMKV